MLLAALNRNGALLGTNMDIELLCCRAAALQLQLEFEDAKTLMMQMLPPFLLTVALIIEIQEVTCRPYPLVESTIKHLVNYISTIS